MCGRYASFLPAEALARIFGTVNPLPNLEPTWNMAPTRDAPVVRLSKDGQRHLDALKWGLVPYFTKDLKKARKPINARSETTSPSPACSGRRSPSAAALSRRRSTTSGATIPMARRRSPWRGSMANPSPSAGIWETWKSPEGETLQTFATITTDANELLAPDSGPHAGHHREGGLAALAWRGWTATRLRCCARRRRTCCDSGRSTRRLATSGTTARSLIEPIKEREPTLL